MKTPEEVFDENKYTHFISVGGEVEEVKIRKTGRCTRTLMK